VPHARHVFADTDAVAEAAAAHVLAALASALAARPRFRIAVSGGRTPADLYRRLARASGVAWDRCDVFFVDERAVAPDHLDSNWRLVWESWLAPLGARAPRAHRMRGEATDLEAAAREYETLLESPLDLVVLGIGEDGHTASLFPGSRWIREHERRVVVVSDSPKPPPRRLTVTPRVLAEAGELMALATGAGKAAAVARALAPAGDVGECPARLARAGGWWLDRTAAGVRP
jgi:6-phosphogluconolactonase